MSGPLAKALRNQLGTTIVKARQSAEAGAKNALEMLAVDRHEPHASMSTEERSLRNRLRARGRQLGDVRDKVRGTQSIDRLIHEIAYEYWHRMLFARFLAENRLLIEPNSGVAISMEECEELAREAGEDPRSMAARFAQDALPQIFRSGDPVLEVALAPEIRQALDTLIDSLPAAVFTADDSLGWTYEYWQSEYKDTVNASGKKIGAEELPAVTQLFTEHYMVLFLFHNTIGAWHAGRVLAANPGITENAQNEDDLREAVRLRSQGGYDFEYLRFVREARKGDDEDAPTGPWRPAAGTFDGWPKAARRLKVLDPCCGSGHFLAEGLELLVRLRMDEEGLNLEDAIGGVLTENLHGLELDARCTQIAAFNLAVAAWKMAGEPIQLPTMQIACSGLAVGSTKVEWTKFAGNDERLRAGMERLYLLFERAPEIGSLIDPTALKGDMFEADFSELQPLLRQALAHELDDVEATERVVTAQGMAKVAELLSGEYTLAITNVPYLNRGKQDASLKEYSEKHYKRSKYDLATVFLERCLDLCQTGATTALVIPQNWWFLKSYSALREQLLVRFRWNIAASLGEEAWQSFGARGPRATLVGISREDPLERDSLMAIDAASIPEISEKQFALSQGPCSILMQTGQHGNPDHRISLSGPISGSLLEKHARSFKGITSGDDPRYRRYFWEQTPLAAEWEYLQSTVSATTNNGGYESVVRWSEIYGKNTPGVYIRGESTWGTRGVAVTLMRTLSASLSVGVPFDTNIAVLLPKSEEDLLPIWTFCASPDFSDLVRRLDQKVNVTNATLEKVPFNLAHWHKIAAEKYPNGLPEPQSDYPTQWLFHGHPAKSEPAAILQVAVGRLLNYHWPPEFDNDLRLADVAREWVGHCGALGDFADDDGIVCLAATRGERSAADRLRELLSAAFGPAWSVAKERELLAVADDGNAPATTLEVWLRDRFFEEHCRIFHHRPFVWHIWDGNREGFHCLVNAHKLTGPDGEGRRTLEAVTYSYLGDWIDRQKVDQAESKEGADARLAAAKDLQGQLVKILQGEPPYDLFTRWKPLHEQPIGWDPDINDGVRLNARPFMNAKLRTGGKKGAGILRWKPNITWKKDRGKEPQGLRPKSDFPWFWGCEDCAVDFAGGQDFDGNRWNDLHYSIAFKQAARERAAERKK